MLNSNSIILLGISLMAVSLELKADPNQASHFKQQIILAESNHRYDIAESAIEHWLSIDENNPEALYFQAQINLLKGDISRGEQEILALEKSHPTYTDINKLKSLLEASSTKKIQLKQAHFLAGNERRKEAIALYEELFPSGMPTIAIEIEYLKLISKRSATDFNKAKKTLQERNKQYPDNPEYKLALANIVTQKMPNDKESLDTYKQLSNNENYKNRAASSWESALSDIPVNKLTDQEINTLLNSFPDNESVSTNAKQLKKELDRYQKLINDPAYKAKLKATKLLKEKKYELAEKLLLLAKKIRPTDPQIFNGLGRIALAQSNYDESLKLFLQGKSFDKSRKNNAEWNSLISTSRYWGLIKNANSLANSNPQSAIDTFNEAIKQNPKEIYPYLAIARISAETKKIDSADNYFLMALKIDKDNKEALLGRINLRIDNNQLTEALALSENLTSQQKKFISDNFEDVKIKLLLSEAETALSHYDLIKANEKIKTIESFKIKDPWLTYRTANILNQLDKKTEANQLIDKLIHSAEPTIETYFVAALYLEKQDKLLESLNQIDKINPAQRSPNIISNEQRIWLKYKFSLLDNLVKLDRPKAVSNLHEIELQLQKDPEQLIRISNYWLKINEPDQARRLADSLTVNDKWLLNTKLDYAQLNFDLKNFDKISSLEKQLNLSSASSEEKMEYHKVMQEYIAKKESENNSRLTNINFNNDPLKSKTEAYVTVFPDYRFGTNTDVLGTAIEGKLPYEKMGHFVFRINPLLLNASGGQDLNAKNFGSSLLRSCYPNCGQQQSTLQATGVGYNIGWMGNHWMADIGRTPENFLVTDVIGGIRLDGDIKSFSWAITAGRRAVRNTVLSYAGLVDPNTGKTWGGARESGAGINLGFDNGGPVGVWSSWQYQDITGENIKGNNKFQGQIGLYGTIWKGKDDIANVDLGLNTLFMSYDNNQNEFTYGNGGYFSPKSYYSFSLPITTYGRYDNWAYSVRLSGGYSMTKTNNSDYYPNDASMQASAVALGASPVYIGSNSNSIVYGVNAILEKRLTKHWSMGARAQLQQSPYYNPSNIGLYFKYDINEDSSQIGTPPKIPMLFRDYMDY